MTLPDSVKSILDEIGQAATDVPSPIEECKEYVSVYRADFRSVANAENRFWYLPRTDYLYRVRRFRILSELVQTDSKVTPDDLWDLQEICLTREEDVAYILSLWLGDLNKLTKPALSSIPV